jgi:hypothetical protein
VTLAIWLVIGLIIHSGLVLRNPPAGELVYEKGNHRVYLLRGISASTVHEVRAWANRYSGEVLRDGVNVPARGSGSASGDVANVRIVTGPRDVQLYEGYRTLLSGRDMALWVYDEPLSGSQVVARIRVALFSGAS